MTRYYMSTCTYTYMDGEEFKECFSYWKVDCNGIFILFGTNKKWRIKRSLTEDNLKNSVNIIPINYVDLPNIVKEIESEIVDGVLL